jgi:hypothetical protein
MARYPSGGSFLKSGHGETLENDLETVRPRTVKEAADVWLEWKDLAI